MTDLFGQDKELKKDQIVIDPYMTPSEYCRARSGHRSIGYAIKVAMDTGEIDSFLINGRVKLKTEQADQYLEKRARKSIS